MLVLNFYASIKYITLQMLFSQMICLSRVQYILNRILQKKIDIWLPEWNFQQCFVLLTQKLLNKFKLNEHP